MNQELFSQLVTSLAMLLSVIISAYVIPFIKSKTTAAELNKLEWYLSCAIRCAEQIYTPEEWKQKKAYVMQKGTEIISDAFKVNMTMDELDCIVEGLVNQIKYGKSN